MKKLLLKAELHNWGRICPARGDWKSITWNIYDDGSYRIDTEKGIMVSDKEVLESLRNHLQVKFTKVKYSYGHMSPAGFSRLKKAIACDPWVDQEIETHACDGVAWDITQYSPDGNVERTNNGPEYIYGHRNLERIVSCLPGKEKNFGGSAYVSVKIKDKNS